MRILLLSSFFFLLSCSKTTTNSLYVGPKNACLQLLKPNIKSVLFNTQVDILNHHLSGLLLMKQLNNDTTRIVFTNEMGLKYFDFEFTSNDFNVIYCMKKLNRKIVIKQLQKIFNLVLMNNTDLNGFQLIKSGSEKLYVLDSPKEQTYYITDTLCSELFRIEILDNQTKKIIINLDAKKNGIADNINIKYQTFKFDINLKQIER